MTKVLVSHPNFFLSTDDRNFGDLFGGFENNSHGIQIIRDDYGTMGASVLIAGHAGTGKTTLAYQLCVKSILRNNSIAQKWQEPHPSVWPKNAIGLICTLDQNPAEIRGLMKRLDNSPGNGVYTLDAYTRRGCADARKLADAIAPGFGSSRFVLTPFDYSSAVSEITMIISDTVDAINLAARDATGSEESVVKIVVIDSINSTVRSNSGSSYKQDFRTLLYVGNPANDNPEAKHRFSTIVTFELDPNCSDPPEEHLPQCVIQLRRERDSRGLRTIEVRKARHQSHFLGIHTARIEENGVLVFPSVAARARGTPVIHNVKSPGTVDMERLRFGLKEIDDVFQDQRFKGKELWKGSSTLLWGPPGSGKSALLIKFMVQQWREKDRNSSPNTESSVLLVTTKIPPRKVLADLEIEVNRDNDLKAVLANRRDIERRYRVVDARNSYRSHDLTFSNVIDAVRDQKAIGRPIERAVVFGLGLIEETRQTRDEQWNFLTSLVEFFLRNAISTLLVDWPIEDRLSPPRAAKLCGNEIMTAYSRDDQEGVYKLVIARGDYGSIMEPVLIAAKDLEI